MHSSLHIGCSDDLLAKDLVESQAKGDHRLLRVMQTECTPGLSGQARSR